MRQESQTFLFESSGLFALVVTVLFVLHQASWRSGDTSLIAGLPFGLAYHLGFCLLVSLVLGLFVYGRKQ